MELPSRVEQGRDSREATPAKTEVEERGRKKAHRRETEGEKEKEEEEGEGQKFGSLTVVK